MTLEILWQGIEEDMDGCVGGGTRNRECRCCPVALRTSTARCRLGKECAGALKHKILKLKKKILKITKTMKMWSIIGVVRSFGIFDCLTHIL